MDRLSNPLILTKSEKISESILVRYLCESLIASVASFKWVACGYLYVFDIAFWRELARSGDGHRCQ